MKKIKRAGWELLPGYYEQITKPSPKTQKRIDEVVDQIMKELIDGGHTRHIR